MNKLSFACSVLAIHFSDALAFNAAAENCIQVIGPGGQFDDLLPLFELLPAVAESALFELHGGLLQFFHFLVSYAFDVHELFLCGHEQRLHCAESGLLQFGQVGGVDSEVLKFVNFVKKVAFAYFFELVLHVAGVFFIFKHFDFYDYYIVDFLFVCFFLWNYQIPGSISKYKPILNYEVDISSEWSNDFVAVGLFTSKFLNLIIKYKL